VEYTQTQTKIISKEYFCENRIGYAGYVLQTHRTCI